MKLDKSRAFSTERAQGKPLSYIQDGINYDNNGEPTNMDQVREYYAIKVREAEDAAEDARQVAEQAAEDAKTLKKEATDGMKALAKDVKANQAKLKKG